MANGRWTRGGQGQGMACSSEADQSCVRLPTSFFTAFTCSGVMMEALLPQLWRIYVSTAARSSSDRAAPMFGIERFHSWPLTVTGPFSPHSGMRIMRFGLPRTHSDPTKDGAWLGL